MGSGKVGLSETSEEKEESPALPGPHASLESRGDESCSSASPQHRSQVGSLAAFYSFAQLMAYYVPS